MSGSTRAKADDDCLQAELTVPKLGAIGYRQYEVVGRRIAGEVGAMGAMGVEEADGPWLPEVSASATWRAARPSTSTPTLGSVGKPDPADEPRAVPAEGRLKEVVCKDMSFQSGGKVSDGGLPFARWSAETFTF